MKKSKTKLYVFTGFLGAGKTTALVNLINNFERFKVGIIQNEIGKTGIDGTILQRDGMEMIELKPRLHLLLMSQALICEGSGRNGPKKRHGLCAR